MDLVKSQLAVIHIILLYVGSCICVVNVTGDIGKSLIFRCRTKIRVHQKITFGVGVSVSVLLTSTSRTISVVLNRRERF